MFGGLNWKPLENDAPFGSTPAASPFSLPDVPSLPPVGGAAKSGASAIKQAATAAGITGGTIAPGATTGNPSVATGAGVLNSWFARGVIVVLGFVFVAVGLSQFGVVGNLLDRR